MRKVCIIGHFGFGEELLNGQTIKTKIITKELRKQLGEKEVGMIDTRSGRKNIPKLVIRVGKAMKNFSNIVIMPAHNGIQFFAPVLCFWKKIHHRKIHYIVIGGWLPKFLKERKWLRNCLKKFDGIYVETSTMKKVLEEQGFGNIFVMPNCKDLEIVSEDELLYSYTQPYKLCTFSRVMKEKGIEDIIRAVIEINQKSNKLIFTLDIYGQVEEDYKERFKKIYNETPDFIQYCGRVSFNQSSKVLKKYFMLVFPTRFYTEGIPGTIIDAFAAGLPVIASKWESFEDIIEDGIVGYGYDFDIYNELKKKLFYVAKNPDELIKMKKNCIDKAKQFTTQKIVAEFIKKGELE